MDKDKLNKIKIIFIIIIINVSLILLLFVNVRSKIHKIEERQNLETNSVVEELDEE